MNEPLIIQLESPPAIVEKDSRRADTVRKRIGEIDTALTLNTFELGDLLAENKTNDYWREWGYESFSESLKASKIDISLRQAEYLIQISKLSKMLKINKTSLAKAKNSKLKEIFSLDPKAVVKNEATQSEEAMSDIMIQLVEDAPSKTLIEIKAIVKRLKGVTEEPEGELTWMNLPVRRDAKQVVVQAIELAQALSGDTIDVMTKEVKDISQAAALERIAGDFLSDPNNQSDQLGEEGEFEDAIENGDEDSEEDLDAADYEPDEGDVD